MSDQTDGMLKKITRKAGKLRNLLQKVVDKVRTLPRKVKVGLSFTGVMALLISMPVIMVLFSSGFVGETTYFTDSNLDSRFDGTGMTGTAGNPYVFEGLTLSASRSDNTFGWKWVFTGTSRYVVIHDCNFIGAGKGGNAITLDQTRNVRIEECHIQGFDTGIRVDHTTDIEISDNVLVLNQVGIDIASSISSTFIANELLQNAVGISADAATNLCSFSLNNFTHNTLAAVDASSGNAWSVDSVGNFYDDYTAAYPSAGITGEHFAGPETSVMVASEPYEIESNNPLGAGTPNSACEGHHDCFPLVFCHRAHPSLGVALPSNDSLHAIISPGYQVAVSGWAITSIYYTIAEFPTEYSILNGQLLYANVLLSGTINATAWASIGTGIYNITFHARNWWGQESNQTIHLEKDITAPTLLITDPVDHAVFGLSSPSYSLSATDPHLASITYLIGASPMVYPASSSGTIDSSAWVAQPDGDVPLTFHANDTLGNSKEISIVVCKDTTAPGLKVWFDSPGINHTVHFAPPAFTIEVVDQHYASAWYVIGSTSYPITGLTGVIDSIAWANQVDGSVSISFHAIDSLAFETILDVIIAKDTQGPVITAIAPGVNSLFGKSAPWFNLAITEQHLSQIWYTLDGGAMNFTCGTQGYLYQGAWALLPNGTANIDFFANDSLGSLSHLVVPVIKDIAPPVIVIYEPSSSYSGGYTPFNYSLAVFDAYYYRAWYTIDGGIVNYTIHLFNGTVDSLAWSTVPAGSVTFEVYAEDYLGNIGTASVVFERDLAPPNIEIVLPTSGTVFGNSPSFNFHVWDQGLAHVWYQVGETGPQFDLPLGPVVSGTVDAGAWAVLPDGNVYLYFHANDTAGNAVCKAVLVVKDSSIPIVSVSFTSSLFGGVPPEAKCSIVDAHENVAYYTLDESSTQYPVDGGAASFIIDAGVWASIGDGFHSLTLHARDLVSNYANATAIFEKDVTLPELSVIVIGAGVYGEVAPLLDVDVADLHMAGSFIFLEFETLEGLLYPVGISVELGHGNATVSIPMNAWGHLWDGSFEVTAFYTDAANNTGSMHFLVGVDKTAPSLVVTQPTSGAIVGQDGVRFGLWVSDTHLSSIWYSVDFGVTNFTLSSQVGNVDPAAWASVWAYGKAVAIQIYANDTCGNEACITIIVMCEAKPPLWERLGITGWGIIIAAAACIFIAIAVHARRQVKKREGSLR